MQPDAQTALASLMDAYIARFQKIKGEQDEAKEEEDFEGEVRCELMLRQVSIMIAELFKTQKSLGFVTED